MYAHQLSRPLDLSDVSLLVPSGECIYKGYGNVC